jgi:hypothetical protein
MAGKSYVYARLAAAVLAASAAFAPAASAIDLGGVQAGAVDQPQINATFFLDANTTPQIATVETFDWDTFTSSGTGQVFTVTGYFDTGASGILLSTATATSLNIPTLPGVVYSDVGVAGTDDFLVSGNVRISLASYIYGRTDLDAFVNSAPVLSPYSPINTSPVRLQIGPYIRQTATDVNNTGELGDLFDALGGLGSGVPGLDEIGQLIAELSAVDVIGMPAMKGKVIVIDPTRINNLGAFFNNIDLYEEVPDVFIHTYAYNPGTPFNPATAATDPGIPTTSHHVKLSYASFDGFTQVTPAGSPGPSLEHNPFIGKDPVRAALGIPQPNTPGIKITRQVGAVTLSSEGNWLLDTGAAASMISEAQAANLDVFYKSGTKGTATPILVDALGVDIPDQFTLAIGGIGGQVTVAGFWLDSLLVRTAEGNPALDSDKHHLHYLRTPVLVNDISLKNPVTGQTITLDGIFGMNMLVSSTPVDSLDPLSVFAPTQGFFNWITFDEPNGILGLNFDPNFLASLGDANKDGKIDAFDLNLLAQDWQKTLDGAPADFNGDGKIDAFDLNLLASNWQFGVPGALIGTDPALLAAAIGVAVPEPASLMALGAGGALLLLRRRRQRA